MDSAVQATRPSASSEHACAVLIPGWPADLGDEEILRRLVALNAERAEEEKRGRVRWLRPE
ncbi:MAG: hypothetical protein ACRYGR_08780, partial [Janthinobacterium lividum]